MLQMPELWNTCQEYLKILCGTMQRERSMSQWTKLKGMGVIKSVLPEDIEMQIWSLSSGLF